MGYAGDQSGGLIDIVLRLDRRLSHKNTYYVDGDTIVACVQVNEASKLFFINILVSKTRRPHHRLVIRCDGENWRIEHHSPCDGLPPMSLYLNGYE